MPATDKKHGILIVDDQPMSLGILELTLKKDHYEVFSATTGDAALEIARQEHPDLVILDMSMPGADGLELCREIKTNSHTEDMVVIFLSAVTDVAVKAEGLDIGAVDYIQKPFNPAELRARVQAHLRLKERLDTLRDQFHELSQQVEGEASRKRPIDPDIVDQNCVRTEKKTIAFKTDVDRVQGVVNQLLVGVAGGLGDKVRNDLALGIHEMVLNAVEHGNLDITSEEKSDALENQIFSELVEERMADPKLAGRTVCIDYEFDGETATYSITDEGKGFDWAKFIERDEPEDLLASNGRGILISRFIFDEIAYNESGNAVLLKKRLV